MTAETSGRVDDGINIEDIEAEVEALAEEPLSNAFTGKRANEWLAISKGLPSPEKLYDEFWCEGELCFLFADSNAGKSIFAVQMADKISRSGRRVAYFDFELSMKQFEKRYSDEYTDHYDFSDNFERFEINTDAELPEKYKTDSEWLSESFERTIKSGDAEVVIVDNITYMRDELEKAQVASEMMKMLNRLKKRCGISILALAHTPKRDTTKPITKNDLGGSKMLINFCDSSFAIGECVNDKSLRYIKQIKVRGSEFRYDGENVPVFQIAKDRNFLEFQFLKYATEREHLKTLSEREREELPGNILRLAHLPQRDIAARLGISVGTVNKHLKRAREGEF